MQPLHALLNRQGERYNAVRANDRAQPNHACTVDILIIRKGDYRRAAGMGYVIIEANGKIYEAGSIMVGCPSVRLSVPSINNSSGACGLIDSCGRNIAAVDGFSPAGACSQQQMRDGSHHVEDLRAK